MYACAYTATQTFMFNKIKTKLFIFTMYQHLVAETTQFCDKEEKK